MTLTRRIPLTRHTRLRAVSTRKRQQTSVYQVARLLIWARSAGTCERCGRHVRQAGFHAHHRRLRSQGGPDCPSNLACLCTSCHSHIHHNVAEAHRHGWIVPSHSDYRVTLMTVHSRGRVLLTTNGHYDHSAGDQS